MHRRARHVALVAAVLGALTIVAACGPTPAPNPSPNPPAPGPAPGTGSPNGSLGSCTVFPADNPWNTDVSGLAADTSSASYLHQIDLDGSDFLHPDFGGGGAYGIPYVTVPGTEPRVPVHFFSWPGESDPGPYPVPLGAPVEGGSDRHVLAVDRDGCRLYEMYNASATGDHWEASNGAVFDLRSNALRPDGWTSGDAAGLPIFAGLVRYDEVAAGAITHALRVTFSATQTAYLHPATHEAGADGNVNRPPMGLRLRLSAGYDVSGFHGQALVIMQALKKYGLIVADNGSNWFITGAADSRWNDSDLDQLKSVPGSAFEVVNTGETLHH